MFELSEQQKLEMYGGMTEEEIKLCWQHEGNYKGWVCVYAGCGQLEFQYTGNDRYKENISAYKGLEVKNWVPECWKECKRKIDEVEAEHDSQS